MFSYQINNNFTDQQFPDELWICVFFVSKNSTRDQGLTSKDDLTVLLGAFDLSSGDDTNRLIQIEFSCSRQERCSTGNWPDCPWGLQQSIVHLERHRPSQARRACWPEHLHPSLPGWPGRRLHWTEWTRLRCFFLHRDPVDRVDFPYHVFWYQVGDLWPPALPRAQMSCRRWRWGFLLGKAIQPLIWKYNSGQHHLGWGVRCSNKRFCYHRGLQWGVHHSGIRKKMIKVMVYNAYITQSASYEGMISEDMICAGAPGKDSCQALSPILKHHHVFVKISCRIIFKKSGRQRRAFHGEEWGNKPTRSCRSRQLGNGMRCGGTFLVSWWKLTVVAW